MDVLFTISGINSTPDPEDIESVTPRLVGSAMDFLQAGGTLTLSDWALLGEPSREAFIKAGGMLRAELSAMIGLSAQGPEQAAAVLSESDDGQLNADMATQRSARKASETLRKAGQQ